MKDYTLILFLLFLVACGGDSNETFTDAGVSNVGNDVLDVDDFDTESDSASESDNDAIIEVDSGDDSDVNECVLCSHQSHIISVDLAASLRQNSEVVFIDARGINAWQNGHITGSIPIDFSQLNSSIDGISNQTIPASQAEPIMRDAGLPEADHYIVYGEKTDMTSARAAWQLTYYGLDATLLDGGWLLWDDLSNDTNNTLPNPSTITLSNTNDTIGVTADWVLDHLDDPEITLVDARSLSEYENGHIPGAIHVDRSLTVAEGQFIDLSSLENLFSEVSENTTIISYCQSGSRAAVGWAALQAAGFNDVRVFDGSWSEWDRRELPQE